MCKFIHIIMTPGNPQSEEGCHEKYFLAFLLKAAKNPHHPLLPLSSLHLL